MFQKGDLIVYGNMGVCRVEAVEAPAGLPGAGEKKLYYKLDPVYETGTVYIPVDAKVFMRPILTHAQAEALIGRIPEIEENPCGGKDQQMLAEHGNPPEEIRLRYLMFNAYRCEELGVPLP